MDRRTFLSGGAAAASAPAIPLFGAAANTPGFAQIGCGNRGGFLQGAFQKLGAKCLAVCDVYEPYLAKGQKMAPDARALVDFKQALDVKGVEAVVIATPDHQHWPMLEAALAAGKDVYLEKPLSMSLEQSRQMVAAVRRTDRIVQIGMQRRSMAFIRKAKSMVDDGALGKISMVKAMWNWHFDEWLDNRPLEGKLDWDRFLGNAPARGVEPRRFRWWRGFWDYSGGNMTDQGTHLMDVVQLITGAGTPLSAVCQGKVINAEGAEVPNVFSAVFEYPDFIATWTLDYRSVHNFDWSILFQGEKASMVLDRHGLRMYREPASSAAPWTYKGEPDLMEQIPDTDKPEAHIANFLECMQTRQQPNCTIEIAAAAVTGPHMANQAFRRKVVFS
jgi:predicted dehydrogenase